MDDRRLTIDTARGLQIGFRDGTPLCTGPGMFLEVAVVVVEAWIRSNPDHPRVQYAERWIEAAEDELARRKPSRSELECRLMCQRVRGEVLKVFKGALGRRKLRASLQDVYTSMMRDCMRKKWQLSDDLINSILLEDFQLDAEN